MNIEELKKQICEYHYGYQFKWNELQPHIKISLLEEIIEKLLIEQKLNLPGVVRPAGERPSRTFVNIYQDDEGRFISDNDHNSYEDAIKDKDFLGTYVETVEIIRAAAQEGELLPAEGRAQGGSDGPPLYHKGFEDGYKYAQRFKIKK